MKSSAITIHANPTPYEYALLSRAAYYDSSEEFKEKEFKYYNYLVGKGWQFDRKINEKNGYRATICTNLHTKQIVLSHRGSENADSWITDLESVVQNRKGDFIRSAIDALSHPDILEFQQAGYRLSTTGHSLGGFLAQVCVYWSQRRDFQLSEDASRTSSAPSSSSSSFFSSDVSSSSTSSSSSMPSQPFVARDISAFVFDSPGVARFLKALHSLILSEKDTIDFGKLNIINFCPRPTVVNTFGEQTGTIMHLGGVENLSFAFAMAHKMESFLDLFDPASGLPLKFIQMTDWPQADYSAYSSISGAIKTVLAETLKLPFEALNALYKKIKHSRSDTWFDRIFKRHVEVALANEHQAIDLVSLEQELTLAIRAHYSKLDDEASRHRLALYHFDEAVQKFLLNLNWAKENGLDGKGWHEALREHYDDDGFQLLQAFKLNTDGERVEVVLSPSYPGSVFEFQRDLARLLTNKGIVLVKDFFYENAEYVLTTIAVNKAKIAQLEQVIHDNPGDEMFIKPMQDTINSLQERLKSLELLSKAQAATNNAALYAGPGIHADASSVATETGAKATTTNYGLTATDVIAMRKAMKEATGDQTGVITGVASSVSTRTGANAKTTNYFGASSPIMYGQPSSSAASVAPSKTSPMKGSSPGGHSPSKKH